ncbi:hypothetical protein TTHERM_000283919 (macronuclear) [Tetrahymena thermophila SB210]|uniref:Uncharacterized protein n=1 Tax=Tetrahymena thermophila (strain SB210) TaxID=312017 RepID=W7XHL3_TETTS|nr:hypothetical protein TTHERM_000283919 [Tetrahymena thermophila SB210]EWS73881.1 hypothetical protein TTHERM_000283919 [Tetrahymena thermophila SB210]|eukprot:XP_012653628.1 hypothetical protein TTHERM_000283919 [Tetrahymena thermophila SB210]
MDILYTDIYSYANTNRKNLYFQLINFCIEEVLQKFNYLKLLNLILSFGLSKEAKTERNTQQSVQIYIINLYTIINKYQNSIKNYLLVNTALISLKKFQELFFTINLFNNRKTFCYFLILIVLCQALLNFKEPEWDHHELSQTRTNQSQQQIFVQLLILTIYARFKSVISTYRYCFIDKFLKTKLFYAKNIYLIHIDLLPIHSLVKHYNKERVYFSLIINQQFCKGLKIVQEIITLNLLKMKSQAINFNSDLYLSDILQILIIFVTKKIKFCNLIFSFNYNSIYNILLFNLHKKFISVSKQIQTNFISRTKIYQQFDFLIEVFM